MCVFFPMLLSQKENSFALNCIYICVLREGLIYFSAPFVERARRQFRCAGRKRSCIAEQIAPLTILSGEFILPDLGSFIAWKGCYQTITSQSKSTRLKTIFMEIYCYCSFVIAFLRLHTACGKTEIPLDIYLCAIPLN